MLWAPSTSVSSAESLLCLCSRCSNAAPSGSARANGFWSFTNATGAPSPLLEEGILRVRSGQKEGVMGYFREGVKGREGGCDGSCEVDPIPYFSACPSRGSYWTHASCLAVIGPRIPIVHQGTFAEMRKNMFPSLKPPNHLIHTTEWSAHLFGRPACCSVAADRIGLNL